MLRSIVNTANQYFLHEGRNNACHQEFRLALTNPQRSVPLISARSNGQPCLSFQCALSCWTYWEVLIIFVLRIATPLQLHRTSTESQICHCTRFSLANSPTDNIAYKSVPYFCTENVNSLTSDARCFSHRFVALRRPGCHISGRVGAVLERTSRCLRCPLQAADRNPCRKHLLSVCLLHSARY